jgi:hypothetical protein
MTTLTPVYTPSETDISNGNVTITLTVWGTDGTEYNDDMELTIELNPEAPIQPTGPDYIELSNAYITDYSTDPVSGANDYFWAVEPEEAGIFTNDGNTGTIVWDRNFAGEATIYAAALNSCGSGPMSEGLLVTVENTSVGTDEYKLSEDRISVYPNPNNGYFNIKINNGSSQKVSLSLFSPAGRLIESFETKQQGRIITFDRKNLPAGLYILVAKADTWVETKKIIIR